VSTRKPAAVSREAKLDQLDDIALTKLVWEREHEATNKVAPDDLLHPAEQTEGETLKVEEMRGEYRVSSDPVGWVRPEAVTHHEEAAAAWRMLPLKELGSWVGGGTPSKAIPAYWETGSIPWVSPKDMKTERIHDSEDHITEQAVSASTANLIPAGSILLVTRSGILRHTLPVAVTTVPVTVNQDLKALIPNEGILAEYVAWALRAFNQTILNTCSKQGTTVNSLETSRLLRFEIPVAPLDQQKRIVVEIEKQFSRLDEAVANLKRVKANLKRYKAAVLKAAVEGRLVETEAERVEAASRRLNQRQDAAATYETGAQLLQRILVTRRSQWQGKGKYKEPAAPDTTDLPELPEGWVWATVEQLNPANRPCAYGVLQPGDDLNEGVLFVRVGDINDGRIESPGLKVIAPAIAEAYPRTKLAGGEVLITLVGAIGRTAVVPSSLAGANVARAVGVLPIAESIDPHWVEIWFRNPKKIAEMTAKSHEVARKTLNLEDARYATVAIPSLVEQHQIVAEVERRLSTTDEAEAQVNANLQRAERLRQSILSRAFSGKPHQETSAVSAMEMRTHG